jgi:hypothetical protein
MTGKKQLQQQFKQEDMEDKVPAYVKRWKEEEEGSTKRLKKSVK